MTDEEHQQELDERRQREDELLRRAKVLTAEKRLSDEEHRIAFQNFTQELKSYASRK